MLERLAFLRCIGSDPSARHARAWLLTVLALALHVLDEALTDFLDFYNPLVRGLRERIPWFPMPTFSFGVWITGLVLLTFVLALLTPVVRRGGNRVRFLSYGLGILMLLNGLGHLAGSVYFRRWLPGATSAPVLLAASVYLVRATWRRRQSEGRSYPERRLA